MNKNIILKDNSSIMDFHNLNPYGPIKGTEIILRDPITEEILQRVHNKVVISGAQYTACKQFGLNPIISFPSYNESMGLDNSVFTAPQNDELVYLFACGINGCGTESNTVTNVDYTKRIQPSELVPFIYNTNGNDISDSYKQMYFGKKTGADGTIAYYFKTFETKPVLNVRYADGTTVDNTIFNPTNTKSAETYVELIMRITKNDFRDYFIANSSLDNARINSLSLLTAWYTTDFNGLKTFQNILPLTELHFANENLSDPTKGIDITYHIFY